MTTRRQRRRKGQQQRAGAGRVPTECQQPWPSRAHTREPARVQQTAHVEHGEALAVETRIDDTGCTLAIRRIHR